MQFSPIGSTSIFIDTMKNTKGSNIDAEETPRKISPVTNFPQKMLFFIHHAAIDYLQIPSILNIHHAREAWDIQP